MKKRPRSASSSRLNSGSTAAARCRWAARLALLPDLHHQLEGAAQVAFVQEVGQHGRLPVGLQGVGLRSPQLRPPEAPRGGSEAASGECRRAAPAARPLLLHRVGSRPGW